MYKKVKLLHTSHNSTSPKYLSAGAAVGPFIANSSFMTTEITIYMLMGFASVAALCLVRLVTNDIKKVIQRFKQ